MLLLVNYSNVAIIVNSFFKFNIKKKHILLFNILDIFSNGTLRAEDIIINEITPSDWVYRSLNAYNYLWQVKYS